MREVPLTCCRPLLRFSAYFGKEAMLSSLCLLWWPMHKRKQLLFKMDLGYRNKGRTNLPYKLLLNCWQIQIQLVPFSRFSNLMLLGFFHNCLLTFWPCVCCRRWTSNSFRMASSSFLPPAGIWLAKYDEKRPFVGCWGQRNLRRKRRGKRQL